MRNLWACGVPLLLLCALGCQRRANDPAAVLEKQPTNNSDVRHGEKEGIPSIEISDLLDALKIDMWKARVNEDPSKRISKVSLLIKQKESDPKSVLTLDLPVDEPGTLLVYLQDNIHERDKIGIVYHGDSGRSGSISDLVDDPFANVVGIQTAISVGVGRPGIIVLRSSGASDDITRPETVAIFLNNE